MALDRVCVAYEQPAESTHCLNLGTRWVEDQSATEGDTRKNCRRREADDGFPAPPGLKLLPLHDTGVGGDKSTTLSSQNRRLRK